MAVPGRVAHRGIALLRGVAGRARALLGRVRRRRSKHEEVADLELWRTRARVYGARAVFNLSHDETELDTVTERQKKKLYPLLAERLRGDERVVLDLGCGPGRFTRDLAEMIRGEAIGVDPIDELLSLAQPGGGARYALMREGVVPLGDGSVDVVFTCLVLGGIRGEVLASTAREIERVLKPGGLFFHVENTTDQKSAPHWTFRSVAEYREMFPAVALSHLSDYDDLGQRISVMAGRKTPASRREDLAVALAGGPGHPRGR